MVPSLPLLSCESSVSVKENPDRKKKYIYHDTFCLLIYKTSKASCICCINKDVGI